MDDVAIFIICVSVFAVAVLVLFAFFPIRVSWFYYRGKQKTRMPVQAKQSSSIRNPYKSYSRVEEDTFDDAEL